MAWMDTNGSRIAKSEKARLKPSYKSILQRADATPEISLHVATCVSIFDNNMQLQLRDEIYYFVTRLPQRNLRYANLFPILMSNAHRRAINKFLGSCNGVS